MSKEKIYKVTGVSHYVKNIMSLGFKNDDFKLSKKDMIDEGLEGRIYEYDFFPGKVELIPEPDNKYDPNAVKVVVDNILVGYIKAGSCKHILNIINGNRIEKIDCTIGGGKYKYLGYDYDDDKYYLDKGESSLYVELKILES